MARRLSDWEVLGLSPTRDVAEIRRAYAKRLKVTRPEDDPDGFQALLAARERALSEAREGGVTTFDPGRAASPAADTSLPDIASDAAPEQGPLRQPLDQDTLDRGDTGKEGWAGLRHSSVSVVESDEVPPSGRNADERPVVVEIGEISLQPPPEPSLIGLATLESGSRDWEAAARLAATVPALDGGPAHAFETWLAEISGLPSGPRRQVEARVLNALMSAWRAPGSDRMEAKAIARTRPSVLRLAPIFGWPREDGVLRTALPALAAATAAQVLREILPPDPADPGVIVVRIGPWSRATLQAPDARAFLESSPRALAAFQAIQRRERVLRRLDLFALAAPHLWAAMHRRWCVALVALAALWAASLAAQFATQIRGAAAAALAAAAITLFAATCVTVSLLADRIMVAGAARAARRASRRGVYEPAARIARLREAGTSLRFMAWAPLVYVGSILFLGPYIGLALLIASAFGR